MKIGHQNTNKSQKWTHGTYRLTKLVGVNISWRVMVAFDTVFDVCLELLTSVFDHEHHTPKYKKVTQTLILPVVNTRYLPNDKTGADSSWRVMVAHQSVENHGRSNKQPGITQTHFGVCRSDIFLLRKGMDKLGIYLHICSIFWQKYLIWLHLS